MDKRDVLLQQTIPTIMVPLHSPLKEPEQPGDRILIAKNGVFIECYRKWGHFIRKIGDVGPVTLPYGECQSQTRLRAAKLPRDLLLAFNDHALKNQDTEVGGAVIWNEVSDSYRLALAKTIEANGSYLHYERPALQAGEHLVIDCHSHAHHRADFSKQDDIDDRYDIKFSYVVGHCNRPQQTFAFRLCLKGAFDEFDFSALA